MATSNLIKTGLIVAVLPAVAAGTPVVMRWNASASAPYTETTANLAKYVETYGFTNWSNNRGCKDNLFITPNLPPASAEEAIASLRRRWKDRLAGELAKSPYFKKLDRQLFEEGRVSAHQISGIEAEKRVYSTLSPKEQEKLIVVGDRQELHRMDKVWAINNPGTFLGGFEAYLDAGSGNLIFLWICPEG